MPIRRNLSKEEAEEAMKGYLEEKNSFEMYSKKDLDDDNPKKSKKSNLKKEIEEVLEQVKNIKIPKKTNIKNMSTALDIADMIVKTPKTKKINHAKASKEIDESIAEIEKLLKAPKKKTKLMQQSKGYAHHVNNISDNAMNYVNEYKSILNSGKSKATITKYLNKLKLDVMSYLKPSEIDDANKLISDYRKTLSPIDKPIIKKVKAESNTYEGDKKYKSLTLYIKKHKPVISSHEDIDIIVKEIIDKNIPRMSVKKLNEVLEDLGF